MRAIVTRRGKELSLATYNTKGESQNLKRGDAEDSRLAAIKDTKALKKEQASVGVVASRPARLRALGMDTATLKSVTLVSPAYVQVLELVGRSRGRGATISEVLDGMNALNRSDKKDDYSEVVAGQAIKGRGPNRTIPEGGSLGSAGMTASQLYPVYDRLTKTGLIFKSIMQKPATGDENGHEVQEGMYRFVMLFLTRFKDNIELPAGCRLEPTAKDVFLEMLEDHLLEVGGTSGSIIPWHNVRRDLLLGKRAAGRVKNFLEKETTKSGFPIRLQMLDVRAMDYNPDRRNRRLEPCISLKHSAELLPQAARRPLGVGLVRAVIGIVKSRGEEGANVDLMQRLLHFSKKSGLKIVELILKNPTTYGIWKGYTREGRSAKVQSLFFDKELLGRDKRKPSAPLVIKSDLITPSRATPITPSGGALTTRSRDPPKPRGPVSPPALVLPEASPSAGKGDDEGGEEGAVEADLDDVNWSDDDAIDALVDKFVGEVDEAEADIFKRVVEGRVKFEMNPAFPEEGCSEATRLAWMQMIPKDRRKSFMLHELEKCKAVPVVKMGHLIRLLEGPGPSMHKHTLDMVVNELLQEGKIQKATSPAPNCWAWRRSPLKTFGDGKMLLHISAETDEASMMVHADNFYRLETSVAREVAMIKAEEVRDDRFKWDAAKSEGRFLVYKRTMHRTMILHRELLRCLPKLAYQRVGSRALDLDRVILDTPLSIFLTMFGYPPDYLHSDEIHKVLKGAEHRKSTIREAPRAIWELMRTIPWYQDALKSSLQILHDMKVLTKVDPPNMKGQSSSADVRSSVARRGQDLLDYCHILATRPTAANEQGSQAAGQRGGRAETGETGDNGKLSAIDKFHRAMEEAAAVRKDEMELGAGAGVGGGTAQFSSLRGMRRDKKARSAASEALLNEKCPPSQMKMGLGWACLHVDVAVYTEDKKVTEPKKVAGHAQWCEFWSTYQFFGTGRREEFVVGSEEGVKADGVVRKVTTVGEGKETAHPLASWLLKKVPHLSEPTEWGVDENDADLANHNAWHRRNKLWTAEQDMALITAVRSFQPEPTFANSKPFRPSAGRPDSTNSVRQALRPVAEWVGKTTEACWRRYKNLARAQQKFAVHGGTLPLPVRAKNAAERKGGKRLHGDEAGNEKDDASQSPPRVRKSRRTGLLARDGPLIISNMDPLYFKESDLNEERRVAREAAIIAKAAGFEWVSEQNSWDEDDKGGGVLPRPFDAWNWSMEDLAAFTAIRQLLLVPEHLFNSAQALKRVHAFRPPTLQKAYRVLLSFKQIDIAQAAWAANEYSVQDCIDHEVYKIIGRHGTSMVTRSIAAADRLLILRFGANEANPLAAFAVERHGGLDTLSDLDTFKLQVKHLCRPSIGFQGDSTQPPVRPVNIPVKDIGADRGIFSSVLEAIARGKVGFTIRLPVETSSAYCAGGSLASSGHGDMERPAATAPGDASSMVARAQEDKGGAEGELLEGESSGVGGQEREAGDSVVDGSTGTDGTGTIRYRAIRNIDRYIMATMISGVRPLADTSSARPVDVTPANANDAYAVHGPEMEWGSTLGSPKAGDEVAKAVVKALKEAGEEGMTLSQLRRAARGARCERGVGVGEGADLKSIGSALRDKAVVCVCGAVDIKYAHEDNAKLWIVPPDNGVESEPVVPSSGSTPSLPTPMEVDSVDEECDETANSTAVAPGWKGKGKKRAGTAQGKVMAANSQDEAKPKVWVPWMNFDGEIDLHLLNRIRQGLVRHIKTNPGSLAGDVREAEFPFLSGGETLLLLRDLVRRKVLREDAVPDTAGATLIGGWGIAFQTENWAKGSESVLDQHVGAAATTSFSPALNWSDMMRRIEGMPGSTH